MTSLILHAGKKEGIKVDFKPYFMHFVEQRAVGTQLWILTTL